MVTVQQAKHSLKSCKTTIEDDPQKEFNEAAENVKPYIYGTTPFYKCFKEAITIMADSQYEHHEKFLLLASDGEPNDEMTEEEFCETKKIAKSSGVHIVSCYVAKNSKVDSLKIYRPGSAELYGWEKGAKFLFESSSIVSSASIPPNILIRGEWNIDNPTIVKDDKIKLFVHANSPENLKTACKFAKDLITSKDCLHQFLKDISLKACINRGPVKSVTSRSFKVPKQEKNDCFAHAGSVAINLTLRLVEKREGGYPTLEDLYEELGDHIEKNPNDDEPAHVTLNTFAQKYRLRVENIETKDALNPWFSKQVVIGYFKWTVPEHENFLKFFQNCPTGVLRREDYAATGEPDDGHAVILANFDSNHLRFMNSWGADWADGGFFKIQNAEVLKMQFMRVYLDKNDLTDSEESYYKKEGAKNIANKLVTLKGLQNSTYQCSECKNWSCVNEYGGKMF